MTFLAIATDGTAEVRAEPATAKQVNAVMPSGWFDLVRLAGNANLYAFVDESGIINGLPGNPVGAVLMATLGAPLHPYAGPVVITGWEEPSDGTEMRDLLPEQVAMLTRRVKLVTDSLAGDVKWSDRETLEQIRRYADFVRGGES